MRLSVRRANDSRLTGAAGTGGDDIFFLYKFLLVFISKNLTFN